MNEQSIKRVKWVKKARQWCTTTISYDEKGKKILKQTWSDNKPTP